MAKDFLYCEETDTKIYSNDVVSISTYPNTKWIVKQGWYTIGSARKHGWYFVSILDKTIISIDIIDIRDITKDTNRNHGTNEPRREVTPTPTQEEPINDYLLCEATDTLIYPNDLVELEGVQYIAKYGWYSLNGIQHRGWYFLSVENRLITPIEDIDLNKVTKPIELGTSEFRPTLQDMDTTPPELNYIVIPNTNIRLYDGDIVKISNKPRIKWVVHSGWFIYQGAQNFGWYFVSIKNGEILPVTIIDLTLCTLVTSKTQSSEKYDGKVVNYTRPFTEYDAEILDRTFITVETIEQRNNLDPHRLVNGRIVRVNDVGGVAVYYAYNELNKDWDKIDEGSGSGIPEIIGTLEHPIILSQLEKGLYRVKGIYLVSPTSDTTVNADIDQLIFVSGEQDVNIKVITESDITDYIVTRGYVTFTNEYATLQYVDGQIALVEYQISEIISELSGFVRKSTEAGATFNKGQWAVFDNSGNIKGLDATASNVKYNPPPSGPTSTVSNVQSAIDILNARLEGAILYDTEENWNAQPQLISAKGSVYVYSNHEIYDGRYIPGVKIGDGVSYLIDMAFIDDEYADHIKDTIIHVSTEDREFWGDKVTCDIDPLKRNTLKFSKE